MILLVGVLGYGFLEASAKAKIANLTTNLVAIVVFGLNGSILWALGLTMGLANLVGGLIGARTALRHGNAFVRRVFLVVLAGLIIKVAYDTVRQLLGQRLGPTRPGADRSPPRSEQSWLWRRGCRTPAASRRRSRRPRRARRTAAALTACAR